MTKDKKNKFIEEIEAYLYDMYLYGAMSSFTVREMPSKSEEHEEVGIFVMNGLNNDNIFIEIEPDTQTMEVKVNGEWMEILDAGDFWKNFYMLNRRKL